jgi:hypothetical protein
MTDLHQALGLDEPVRMADYLRITELVSPIAEADDRLLDWKGVRRNQD